MRKTIIQQATGIVTNVIELEPNAQWTPPAGEIIGTDGGELGQKWDGSAYVNCAPAPDTPN